MDRTNKDELMPLVAGLNVNANTFTPQNHHMEELINSQLTWHDVHKINRFKQAMDAQGPHQYDKKKWIES